MTTIEQVENYLGTRLMCRIPLEVAEAAAELLSRLEDPEAVKLAEQLRRTWVLDD